MRLFRLALVSAGLVGVLAMAGCASSLNSSRPSQQGTVNLNNLVLPLESYQLPDSQLERMDVEWGQLMTRCAADYGAKITYGSDYTPGFGDFDGVSYWGGPFGTMSKAQASRYGYIAGPNDPTQPVGGFYVKDPGAISINNANGGTPLDNVISFGRPTSKKDPNYSIPLPNSVTTGKPLPTGGCQAIVQSQIGAPLVSDTNLIADMIGSASNYSHTQTAFKSWSSCMKSAGYSYKTPINAAQSIGPVLDAGEVKQAVADVDCTASSKWAIVFYTKLIADENAAIPKNTQLLQGVLSSQQRVLKKLDELVGQ